MSLPISNCKLPTFLIGASNCALQSSNAHPPIEASNSASFSLCSNLGMVHQVLDAFWMDQWLVILNLPSSLGHQLFLPTTNIHPIFTNIAPGKTCRLPAMTLEISGRLLMDLALPAVSPMSTDVTHKTKPWNEESGKTTGLRIYQVFNTCQHTHLILIDPNWSHASHLWDGWQHADAESLPSSRPVPVLRTTRRAALPVLLLSPPASQDVILDGSWREHLPETAFIRPVWIVFAPDLLFSALNQTGDCSSKNPKLIWWWAGLQIPFFPRCLTFWPILR